MQPTTSRFDDQTQERYCLTVDWLNLELAQQAQRSLETSDYSHQEILSALLPFSRNYFSARPTLFLLSIKDFAHLNRSPSWIIRDGLIPLFWFFNRFPTPERFQTRLLIEEKFMGIVPRAWKKQIGTYRYGSIPGVQPLRPAHSRNSTSRTQSIRSPRKLLLFGQNSELFLSMDYLKGRISSIARHCKNMRVSEVLLYLPLSNLRDPSPSGEIFPNRVILEIIRGLGPKLGQKIRLINAAELENIPSFQDFLVEELNHEMICADSHLKHYLASRGAQFLSEGSSSSRKSKPDEVLPTEMHHGFLIRNTQTDKARGKKREELISSILDTGLNTRFPWPLLFKTGGDLRITHSGLTELPTSVIGTHAHWEIGYFSTSHSLDILKKDRFHYVFEGWAYEGSLKSSFKHLVLASNIGEVYGELIRRQRHDVVKTYPDDSPGDLDLGWGFHLEVPLSELKWHYQNGARKLWLIGLYSNGIGIILEQLKLTNEETLRRDSVQSLSGSGKIEGDSFFIKDLEKLPNRRFNILEPVKARSAGYEGILDLIQIQGGEIIASGWSLHRHSLHTPDAILICNKEKIEALSFARNLRRDDIASAFSGSQTFLSGFQVKCPTHANSVKDVRIFAFYSDKALAVPLSEQSEK